MEYLSEGYSVSYTDTASGLDIDTADGLRAQPMSAGVFLANRDVLGTVILGAIEKAEGQDKDAIVQQIMGGLCMDGVVQWEHVRFPKFHRLMGRVVIGNRRYYTPLHPID